MGMRGFPDYRARARFKRFLFSKTVAVLLAGVFVFVAQAAWGMYEKNIDARERSARVGSELQALEARVVGLRSDIERLSDERGIEEEIRTRFMVAKEGEEVLVITGARNNERALPTEPSKKGIFERLLGAVGVSWE